MRTVTGFIVVVMLYFAASLIWPARYDGPRFTPPAAADSPYVQNLRARPAPDDVGAYTVVAVDLAVVKRIEEADALASWMERHLWLRFLGRAEEQPANVGAAIDDGSAAAAELPALRSDVLAHSVSVEINKDLDPALLQLFIATEDLSRGRTVNAVVPGLWSNDIDNYHAMRLATRVTNISTTPIASLRLVVAWDGDASKQQLCDSAGSREVLRPGTRITLWCHDMAEERTQAPSTPIDWMRSGSSNGDHRIELVGKGSSLTFPKLDIGVQRSGGFLPRPLTSQIDSARSASEREHNCFELGNCTRVMFRPASTRLAVLVWCLLALGVFITAQSVRRLRAEAFLLGLFTCGLAVARSIVATGGDVHALPLPWAAGWLLACAGLVATAWQLRAPLPGRLGVEPRPPPEEIFARFTTTATGLGLIAFVLFGVFLVWVLLHVLPLH